MQRLARIAIVGLIVLAAPAAHAKTVQTFSLRNQENVIWKGYGSIGGKQQEDGLMLHTMTSTGVIATQDFLFPNLPDAVTIVTSSDENLRAYFAWRLKVDGGLSELFQVPITIPSGPNMRTSVQLKEFSDWQADIGEFGLVLPPESDVLLTEVAFDRWFPMEKIGAFIASWFSFDQYRPYSINFLWGPEIGWNPLQRAQMWSTLPPAATSGTFLLNIILLVVIVVLCLFYRIKKGHIALAMRPVALVCIAAWMLFDLRMGGEYLAWTAKDLSMYSFASHDTRTFRDRGRFYDFISFVEPLVADRRQYVFMAQQEWPFVGAIRYATYPIVPTNDFTENDTWVIYDRPDVGVDAHGQLTIDGEALTAPGQVLGTFGPGSFVFRLQ
jgi:hypothetical protein